MMRGLCASGGESGSEYRVRALLSALAASGSG
jgi:hypothetical protein